MARFWISRLMALFAPPPPIFVLTSLLALFALGICSHQASANPTTYYVATDGSNFNTGLSWSSPKSDLQGTIHAAVSGDQVWVEAGTYTDTNNFTPTDGVAVYGHFAGTEMNINQRQLMNQAYTTTLEQTGSGTIYTIPSGAVGTNTLDGFTIQNGTSGGLVDNTNDTLIVANCMFTSNSGTSLIVSNATINNCVFTSNVTEGVGGSVYTRGTNTTIGGCTFTDNSAGDYGGAIYAIGTATTISGCTFSGNSAGIYGGAVFAEETTTTINGCTFTGNSANNDGGAVYVDGENGISTISDCTFGGSSTSDADTPQSIYLAHVGYRSTTPPTPAVVKDNLIIGNGTATTGADGIDIDTSNSGNTSYATIANNTIVNANIGINIATSTGAVNVANNIFYGDYGSLNDTGAATFTSSHNDNDNNVNYYYQGVNPSSTDLLSVDPMFVDAGSGNYHLSSSSPLINAGDDSYVTTGDTDLDGHARIQGSHVDIGCYETSATATATLTSISPSSVQAGDNSFTLTVTGTGFVSGGTVQWNGTALSTHYVSATQLTATVPASLVATAGTASVTELNPGASASNAKTFTITAAATLTSLSPTSKPADSAQFTLTVNGTNFLPGAVVYWNTAGLTTTEVSSTELTAIVPASDLTTVGTVMISAANPHTAGTNALTFTVTTPVAAITSLSPSSVQAGSAEFILSVNGSNFVSGSVVKWNGAALQTAYFNGTILAALVPASDVASAGTASITVANPGVAASNALTFTITGTTAPPTITSISPTSGPVGTVVTITGTNLSGATRVRFHNANATTYSVNAAGTQLTVTVPSGAGTGTITVDTPGGGVTSSQTFTVILPPTVTSFTPTSGPVGTVITVTGTNLNGVTAVRFHNANATVFSANGAGTQLTVTVPTGAGTGTFSITTPGGTVKTTGTFTVN